MKEKTRMINPDSKSSIQQNDTDLNSKAVKYVFIIKSPVFYPYSSVNLSVYYCQEKADDCLNGYYYFSSSELMNKDTIDQKSNSKKKKKKKDEQRNKKLFIKRIAKA